MENDRLRLINALSDFIDPLPSQYCKIHTRAALSKPDILSLAASELLNQIDLESIDLVGTQEVAGIPLVVSLSLLSARTSIYSLNWFSVSQAIARGANDPSIAGSVMLGADVVLVDDTVLTGYSMIKAHLAVTRAGMNVKQILVLVDESIDQKGIKNIEKNAKCPVSAILTFDEIVASVQKKKS